MPSKTSGNIATDTFVTSAARTAAGDSGVWDGYLESASLRAFVNVTAVSGTSPVLTAMLEDSPDGTNWYQLAATANITAAGQTALNYVGPFSDRVRVRYTIAGTTPSFTFEIRVLSQGANY